MKAFYLILMIATFGVSVAPRAVGQETATEPAPAAKPARPPGSPAQIRARLEGKIQKLQESLTLRQKSRKEIASLRKRMEAFSLLMDKGQVLEAEKLIDSVLTDAAQ